MSPFLSDDLAAVRQLVQRDAPVNRRIVSLPLKPFAPLRQRGLCLCLRVVKIRPDGYLSQESWEALA
jgi:hypothetical protein